MVHLLLSHQSFMLFCKLPNTFFANPLSVCSLQDPRKRAYVRERHTTKMCVSVCLEPEATGCGSAADHLETCDIIQVPTENQYTQMQEHKPT